MYAIVLALHIFVCFLLIIAVLLQNSKGSDLGAALGGGSGEMFGPKAPANIMNKITTVIAGCFLALSLILAIMSGLGNNNSIMRNAESMMPLNTEAPAGGQIDAENMPMPANHPPVGASAGTQAGTPIETPAETPIKPANEAPSNAPIVAPSGQTTPESSTTK